MMGRVNVAARNAGRDPKAVSRIYNLEIRLGTRPPEEYPTAVFGTVDQIVAELARFARLGFDSFNFLPVGPDEAQQLGLGREVLPLARVALAEPQDPGPSVAL